ELEASLHAHSQVLGKLAGKKHGKVEVGINAILSDVQNRTDQTTESRQSDESKLSGKQVSNEKKVAENKLNAANHVMQEAATFVENKKTDISDSTYAKAQADLQSADDAITQGKAELNAGNYNN